MGNNSDEDSALSIEFNDSEEEVDEGDIEEYKILHKENSYEDHESEDSETCDDKQEDADENEGNEYIMNRFPTHKLLKNMSEYKWEVGTLYNTKLLAAIGRDPNEQMLPIAIAVVEAETKDSWTWFLSNLIEDLGGTNRCRSYTFISDQQKVNFIIFCSSTLKTYIV